MFGRCIEYLRISITDRCNLRCRYCMPPSGITLTTHGDILRLEEIAQLVKAGIRVGIKRLRLTGGEPLLRKNVATLVSLLKGIPGIEEVSMTTNGLLLENLAHPLKAAGLDRINISLDTLRPDRYRYITRWGDWEKTWRGIEAALEAGLHPVKLNVVVLRGFNDDEILDFARLTLDNPLHVRFIELMPLGEALAMESCFMSAEEVRAVITQAYALEPDHGVTTRGPAVNFRIPGAEGTLGFISALSQHFCQRCNRLRLTADGKLRPCLFSDLEIDVKGPLRSGASEEELAALFAQAIALKPQGHHLKKMDGVKRAQALKRAMHQIGG
ncbi:MAG TPA: GTP 3',8-cyclase MoaA [Moorella mulderi]|nr:GTP 3',8-cyclase MoaA [Moorella mulderi]